ncbi:MAG: SAM-dependent methyltransferase, partial [Nitrospirae bacterium]|nr:SAM-dependent methyltransferase [Nitrospirota bacterium]
IGVDVTAIPGPSALTAALSVSGLSTEEFVFIGFLPSKPTQRRKRLEELRLEQRTLVFYEAPHRILEVLLDVNEIFGERSLFVIKEITKIYEEAYRGMAADVIELLKKSKIAGEYVLVVEGKKRDVSSFDDALHEVRLLIKKGRGRKEAVSMIAKEYGLSKKGLYDRSLGVE